jgi:hypothetical protein
MIEETIPLNVPTERPKIIGCDSRFQSDIEQDNTIIVFAESYKGKTTEEVCIIMYRDLRVSSVSLF